MRLKALLFVILNLTFLQVSFSQDSFYSNLAEVTVSLTQDQVVYDPSYFSITYPNGDVPKGKGVCTDVVIRAYRKLGVDLQKEVRYMRIWQNTLLCTLRYGD
ncbi:DUF1287 domain-containing protein [Limibacter armeniacum]|uniref:DUF1287 domain-containing protein n=1 Tax=Limibacter armeniacum TaxID=466084 RepID=UPI002FE66524